MSYLVLARKYRPSDFSSVSGQDHVTRTLANAIKRDKVVHAFLFSGPRGVGKTSVARVLAKALNCQEGPTATPCLKCTNCKEIEGGKSLAVMEIDGASHNSVENVRELIDTLKSLPAPGSRYKVYIIDEVHMLSIAAFNALLKSLEEPPPNTIFILATTEVHKIPDTVISRCQRHDFRAIRVDVIEDRLREIVKMEKIQAEAGALRAIARLADGSMRDAQTLLDRVQSFSDGDISNKHVSEVLGVVEKALLFRLSHSVFSKNSTDALSVLSEVLGTGIDPRLFLQDFATHWREILIAKFSGEEGLKNIGVSQEDLVELRRQVESATPQEVQALVSMAREGADTAIRSAFPKYVLEALLVRLCNLSLAESKAKSPPTQQAQQSHSQVNNEAKAPRAAPGVPVKTTAPTQASTTSVLDLRSFVNFISESSSKLLAEQIKRLSVRSFKSGEFVADGPAFCVDYILKKDNIEKLRESLSGFSSIPEWNIKLQKSGESASPGSIVHEEKQEKIIQKKNAIKSVSSHPTIENLKKVFPGTEVENIDFNDGD